ncbi:hypothetical protein VNN28_09970 (plasmid) [Lactococcus formosensis]|uniref:hypothetical protein n=1 Tax=Lactococcus formosensis TaxID=1281486 RepID=UPI0030D03626
MNVEKNEVLRVLIENKSKKFALRFYSAQAVHGEQFEDLVTFETIIPRGTMVATYTHLPEIKMPVDKIIREEWENIAYIKMEDEVICERSQYGAQMSRISPKAFEQPQYEEAVEKELTAQARGREIVLSEDTEAMASSIMKGYAKYYKDYRKEVEEERGHV